MQDITILCNLYLHLEIDFASNCRIVDSYLFCNKSYGTLHVRMTKIA